MRRTLAVLAVLFLASAGIAGAAEPPLPISQGHPTLTALWDAYQHGEITEAQLYLYRLYFVKDATKLPAEFQFPEQPYKCGTSLLKEAFEHADELPVNVRDEIKNYQIPRGDRQCTIETTHFCIHRLAGTQAYAESIALYCEQSWEAYHVDRTWDAPPQCGTHSKIDVYIEPLSGGILGSTWTTTDGGGPEPWDRCSEFNVDDNIASWCTLRSTVCHEYMHVVQFGYLSGASWFMENCAMIGEEQAYDYCNDYIGYLQSCIGRPYLKVNTHDGQYEYGNILWPLYMWERFYEELLPEIWDIYQWDGNIWDSLDEGLAAVGYNVNSALLEYNKWLYYTRWRANAQHYSEARSWLATRFPDQQFSTYPTGDQHPRSNPDMRPEPYGTSVQRFRGPANSGDNALEVNLNGPNCTLGAQLIVNRGGQGDVQEFTLPLDSAGDGQIMIPNFVTAQDSAMLMVTMGRTCNGRQDFIFSGDTVVGVDGVPADGGEAVSVDFNLVSANPAPGSARLSYTLPRSCGVEVRIVSADGRTIRTLVNEPQGAGVHQVSWDGNDDSGHKVGGGLYWARIRAGSDHLSQKVVLLK